MTRGVLESFLPETLEFLRRLVGVNSFTRNREGVLENARLVAGQFQPLGFSAESVAAEDPAYGDHLFLRRRGTGSKGLLLVTHLDTVYPPEEEAGNQFSWQAEEGRIFGPGVNDNKGGTAMIWLVLAALREASPEVFEKTHWVIAANAAEEDLPADFPRRCRERVLPSCRAGLVFEACGGQGHGLTLVRCRKGSANLRVWAEGRGAHAGSRHHEGANAIAALAAAVGRIEALTDPARGLTANVGWISGGGPANRVPHFAECLVNLRAFDETVLRGATDQIVALPDEVPAVRAISDGYAVRLRAEVFNQNPPWPQNAQTDALIGVWQRAAEREGIALLVEPRGGLSDGNYLSQFLPVLDGLGPFGLHGHASERSADGSKIPEFVVPSSFVEMGLLNAAAMCDLCAE